LPPSGEVGHNLDFVTAPILEDHANEVSQRYYHPWVEGKDCQEVLGNITP
jgi:hypothetical protein